MPAQSKRFRSPSRPHLRIYSGPTEEVPAVDLMGPKGTPNTVTVPLGEILPLLVDAVHSERTWLRDFAQDEVTISTDLYEVILAYQYYRRPSA